MPNPLPLAGLLVVDFSTLLPGPLASLLLLRAGARVVKIERPPHGDEMRAYAPLVGPYGANYALLNRGKQIVAADLRDARQAAQVMDLVRQADVLIEQFRPGVLDRLGFGYAAVADRNPRLIYCSITGFGQTGPDRLRAAHDLNYLAETGMLALTAGPDGAPQVPPALIADIGAGAYPAVMNILLAVRQRDATGSGLRLDVSMTDNLFTWMFSSLGSGLGGGQWPTPGGELLTGASPRYAIYRTADARYLAVAALEDRFWQRLCELVGLLPADADDHAEPEQVRARLAALIGARRADEWQSLLDGEDVCCNVVRSVEEASHHPHFIARGLFQSTDEVHAQRVLPALHVPLDPALEHVPPETTLDLPVNRP